MFDASSKRTSSIYHVGSCDITGSHGGFLHFVSSIPHILVGGFNLPLWKMMEWVTVGMMTFPIYGKSNSCSKPPTSIVSHIYIYIYTYLYMYIYIYVCVCVYPLTYPSHRPLNMVGTSNLGTWSGHWIYSILFGLLAQVPPERPSCLGPRHGTEGHPTPAEWSLGTLMTRTSMDTIVVPPTSTV